MERREQALPGFSLFICFIPATGKNFFKKDTPSLGHNFILTCRIVPVILFP